MHGELNQHDDPIGNMTPNLSFLNTIRNCPGYAGAANARKNNYGEKSQSMFHKDDASDTGKMADLGVNKQKPKPLQNKTGENLKRKMVKSYRKTVIPDSFFAFFFFF